MSENPSPESLFVNARKLTDEAFDELGLTYFNGFTVAFSGSDFTLILKQENRPVQYLKASFTVAKSLAEDLKSSIDKFENATGHNIMTMDEVATKLKDRAEK